MAWGCYQKQPYDAKITPASCALVRLIENEADWNGCRVTIGDVGKTSL